MSASSRLVGSGTGCSAETLAAWRGNYSQRDVMQEIRSRLRKFRDLRTSVRNLPSFNIGGGNFEIEYVIRGPDLKALADYAEQLRARSQELGIIDADTTLKLNKPELRVEIDRARAADLGVDTEDIATALRLMVGGEEEVSRFLTSRSTKIMMCNCVCAMGNAMTPRPSCASMCRARGRTGAPGQCGAGRAGAKCLAHRSAGPPAQVACALGRPGLCLGRPS